jgi:hypothetical protein
MKGVGSTGDGKFYQKRIRGASQFVGDIGEVGGIDAAAGPAQATGNVAGPFAAMLEDDVPELTAVGIARDSRCGRLEGGGTETQGVQSGGGTASIPSDGELIYGFCRGISRGGGTYGCALGE